MSKLIAIIMLLSAVSFAAFAENTTKENLEKMLVDKKVNPFERYNLVAKAIVHSDFSNEQSLAFYETVMLPFCKNEIKDTEHRNIACTNTYDCIRMFNNRLVLLYQNKKVAIFDLSH